MLSCFGRPRIQKIEPCYWYKKESREWLIEEFEDLSEEFYSKISDLTRSKRKRYMMDTKRKDIGWHKAKRLKRERRIKLVLSGSNIAYRTRSSMTQ